MGNIKTMLPVSYVPKTKAPKWEGHSASIDKEKFRENLRQELGLDSKGHPLKKKSSFEPGDGIGDPAYYESVLGTEKLDWDDLGGV
jgi:hypothetical protein